MTTSHNRMSSFGLPPIRCHSCGLVVAPKILAYRHHMTHHPDATKAESLDAVGLNRICCRSRALGYAPDPATYETVPTADIRGHVELLSPTHHTHVHVQAE